MLSAPARPIHEKPNNSKPKPQASEDSYLKELGPKDPTIKELEPKDPTIKGCWVVLMLREIYGSRSRGTAESSCKKRSFALLGARRTWGDRKGGFRDQGLGFTEFRVQDLGPQGFRV